MEEKELEVLQKRMIFAFRSIFWVQCIKIYILVTVD